MIILLLYTGQSDVMDLEATTNSDDTSEKVHQRNHEHVRESHAHLKMSPTKLDQEILAAEEFEKTSSFNLDFDPEVEWF